MRGVRCWGRRSSRRRGLTPDARALIMLLNDIEKVLSDELVYRCRHVQVLHPIKLVALSICDAQVPILLRVAVTEFTADMGDVVAVMIVPDIQHEVEDVVVYDTVSKSFQRGLDRSVCPRDGIA